MKLNESYINALKSVGTKKLLESEKVKIIKNSIIEEYCSFLMSEQNTWADYQKHGTYGEYSQPRKSHHVAMVKSREQHARKVIGNAKKIEKATTQERVRGFSSKWRDADQHNPKQGPARPGMGQDIHLPGGKTKIDLRPAKPKVAPPLHDIGKYQHSGPGLKDFAAKKTAEHQAAMTQKAAPAAEKMAQKAAPEAEKVTSKAIQKIAPKAEKVVSRLGTKGKLIAGGTAAVAGLAALAISKRRAAAKAKLLAGQKVKK